MKSILSFFNQFTVGKKLYLLFTPLLGLIAGIKLALLGLGILILLDLITGIRKSLHVKKKHFNPFKKDSWKIIKSYLLRQTWRKTTEYIFGIIGIAVLETMILQMKPIEFMDRIITITELSIVLASAIEIWSIFENMEAVTGRNLLKKMMGFLPKKVQSLFNKKSKED